MGLIAHFYCSPNCQLEVDVIGSKESVALLHSHILQPAMPLAKFSTYFCQQVIFQFIIHNLITKLKHLHNNFLKTTLW